MLCYRQLEKRHSASKVNSRSTTGRWGHWCCEAARRDLLAVSWY